MIDDSPLTYHQKILQRLYEREELMAETAAAFRDLVAENKRLRAASAIVAALTALVPLSETIEAAENGHTLVEWFKERLAEHSQAETEGGK